MDYINENIEGYNPEKDGKVLILFDVMITEMLSNN